MASTLTRKEMEQVLAEGGAVLYKNVIITDPKQLPSEADLAEGDAARTEAARQSLLEQQKMIDEQLAKLGPASSEESDKGGKKGEGK